MQWTSPHLKCSPFTGNMWFCLTWSEKETPPVTSLPFVKWRSWSRRYCSLRWVNANFDIIIKFKLKTLFSYVTDHFLHRDTLFRLPMLLYTHFAGWLSQMLLLHYVTQSEPDMYANCYEDVPVMCPSVAIDNMEFSSVTWYKVSEAESQMLLNLTHD